MRWRQLQSALVLAPTIVWSQTSSSASSSAAPSSSPSSSPVVSTGAATITSTSYRSEFTVPASATIGATVVPNIEDPQAVDAQTVCPGYNASQVQATENGFTAQLALAGEACNVYGMDIEALTLNVEYQTSSRLHVSVVPSYLGPTNTSYFVLSENLIPIRSTSSGNITNKDLTFSWSNAPSFYFNVTRTSSGAVLFSTMGSKLVFENQFMEFVTSMPENYNLYGLGESIHGLRLGNNFTKTMYAADVGDPIDLNIYGSHPFYLDTRYYEVNGDGDQQLIQNTTTSADSEYRSYSHGVFLRNAHGQEILLRASSVTWRTIGGSLDLYFFSGPSAADVTSQYLEVIGLPALQQYHTFGYHQCRWGYANWSMVEDVVNNHAKFEIPLEHIWTDIDYMNQYRDFDNDAVRFNYTYGQEFLSRLHANGQYYIPIIDSAIYVPNPMNESDAYPPFTNGNSSGAFILNPDGSLYIGDVWPGYTAFPDWLSNGTQAWWTNEMQTWHDSIAFDGAWVDMSEASSFCIGSCGSGNITLNPVHPPFALGTENGGGVFDYPEGFNLTNSTEAASASSASSSFAAKSTSTSTTPGTVRSTPEPTRNVNYPPYVINNVQGELASKAVSPNATHHDGTLEYDVHNLFGHQIIQNTYNALLSIFPGKRPFIIGRSTFAGTGVYGGHWGGDNASKWYYMFFSIPQALSFSLFGIPMFGVDTCGFNGNSDEELCNRWMQLSAFFPFYRNHNTLGAISQEAYVWSSVIEATKTAMAARFALLPYMYTLFYQAHTTGSTVMRALAWNFPNDPSLANADRQFFLGDAILVTPVLDQGATTVDGVFPGLMEGTDVYYDWYNQSQIETPAVKNTTIDAPLGYIPVYIRGGNVLATQEMAMTTRDARKSPWSLLVALGVNNQSTGSLNLDDGESVEPSATKTVDFSVQGSSLYANVTGDYADTNPLANVTILGLGSEPQGTVSLNGNNIGSGSWNSTTGVFSITGLANYTSSGAWASGNWTLSWQ